MLKVTRDPETGRIKRLLTGDVMFSYAYLLQPRPETDLKKGTFGADLIILDDETLTAIKEYLQEVIEDGLADKWEGKAKDLHVPLRKGNEESDIEAGHYVLKTTTNKQPKIHIRDEESGLAHEITEDEVDEIYSGMIGEAIIQFSPYNYLGRKGITCYLNAVCKTGDGTVLGGVASYVDEFSLGSDFDAPVEVPKKGKKRVVVEEEEEDAPSLDALISGSVVTKDKPASKSQTKAKAKEEPKRPSIDDLINS